MKGKLAFLTIGALCLAIFSTIFMGLIGKRGKFSDAYSSFRSDRLGLKGLYLLLESMGFMPQRLTHDLERVDLRGVLISVAPKKLGRYEVEGLLDWVHQGGRLVLVTGEDTGVHRRLGLHIKESKRSKPAKEKTLLNKLLHGRVSEARGDNALKNGHHAEAVQIARSQGASLLAPLGLKLLSRSFRHFSRLANNAGVLFEHHNHSVVQAIPHGKGLVIAVSEPYLLTNEGIGRGDNLLFFTRLIDALSLDKRVYFDEYHHGFIKPRGVMAYLFSHNLHWLLIQLILVVLIIIWRKGKRFGRPRGEDDQSGRQTSDYVHALANIYRHSGLQSYAVDYLYQHVKKTIAAHVHRPSERDFKLILDHLRELGREKLASELQKLEETYYQLNSRQPRRSEIIAFAREITRIMEEIDVRHAVIRA